MSKNKIKKYYQKM